MRSQVQQDTINHEQSMSISRYHQYNPLATPIAGAGFMSGSYVAGGGHTSAYLGTPTLDPMAMRTPNSNSYAQSLERDRILTMGRMSTNNQQ